MEPDTTIDLRDLRDTAVGIEPETMGLHDSVLAALAAHYENAGHAVDQLWVADLPDGTTGMFDLYVPDLHRLIDVETNDTMISLGSHDYDVWRSAGYEVWVVAPLDKVGTVERRLRSKVDRIQPWTTDGVKVTFEHLVER